jgi:hypothetical protein
MSRARPSRRRALRFEERLAWWREQTRAHLCRRLARGLERGAYELIAVPSRGDWKLVLIPNASPAPRAWDERCRHCPYCGARVAVVAAPPKPAAKRAPRQVVPDYLPPEVGR